ncbi:hypothetical protein BDR26DRAFT_863724 [Obelidium mucronatum]|nr:hypothetical protein BDR26DRAFT_863724 [Obelidium mucronatum]
MLDGGPWQEQNKTQLDLKFDDSNITLSALKILFARIYGCFEDTRISSDNVLSLLATACFFDDRTLSTQCLEFIESNLSATTLLPYLAFSEENCYGIHSDAIANSCLIHLCKQASNTEEYLDCFVQLPEQWLSHERFDFIQLVLKKRAAAAASRRMLLVQKGQQQQQQQQVTISPIKAQNQKHLRQSSTTASIKTLVEEEEEDSINDSFGKLTASSAGGEYDDDDALTTTELETLSRSILSRAVIFSSMTFPQLQQIKQTQPIPPPIRAIYRGLWQQQELRSLIISSDSEAIDLGISYKVDNNQSEYDDEDGFLDFNNHESASAGSFNHLQNSNKKDNFMPTQDTETMDGSKSLVDLIKHPSQWNKMQYPPFRFGHEFTQDQLENMDKHVGSKVFSSQNFYGGSMWQLYIQKLDGVDGAALGIYMQRMVPPPAATVVVGADSDSTVESLQGTAGRRGSRTMGDISQYVDGRVQAKVWFQIVCYFSNSCCVLESKPDLFKATQSWGWRSTKMYKDVFGSDIEESVPRGHKREFKAVVIIGQT